MLQATLETEFLDTMLKAFESPLSESMFTQIYETFERATDPDDSVEPAVMSQHLVAVKNYLAEAKNSSGTQFRCFFSGADDA
ncbi:hypothetical protein HDU91_002795 [Kappamyces sp. JEL0680]|nr:hypothetical protein HDU91_002795 [Kappamyces sp. JEL0680]